MRAPRSGPLPRSLLIALLALLGVASSTHAPSQDESPARDAEGKPLRERELPLVRLVGGQAIVGKLAHSSLRVRTRYGELEVPVSDVVKIRLGPSLTAEGTERCSELLRSLQAKATAGEARDEVLAALRRLGQGAYPQLLAAREDVAYESAHDSLEALLEEIRSIDEVWLEKDDEIVTVRFTIRGRVLADSLGVERFSRVLEIPRSDVVEIAWGETEVRKTFKVGAGHMESQGFLDSKLEVKKGQRISLSPKGQMTWQGQTFGPSGISNHTWNGRHMGVLQWRVGAKGPWLELAGDFDGKAPASGPLQFCVHLTGGGATGEFKVEYRARKK